MANDKPQFIFTETREGVATLNLNRPPVNILHIPMLKQLKIALGQLAEDSTVRVLVLGAEGKLFSAGVDVADHTDEKVGEMIPLFDKVCRKLAEFPVPTIAAVNGHALGGGCELVLCCDLAVMAESAKIGQPEIQLAAIAPVAAMRLPYLVGFRAAADLMFTGRNLTAKEAVQMGLVNAAVPLELVTNWAQDKATQIAILSRSAMVLLKRSVTRGFGDWTASMAEIENLYLNELMQTADAHEGLKAFIEKRKPVWAHE